MMPDADTPPQSKIADALDKGTKLGRFITGLSAEKLIALICITLVGVLCVATGFLGSELRDMILRNETRNEDQQAQYRRDAATLVERHSQDRIATGSMILKHCAEQDKIRREEDALARRDAIAVQAKLADAVNNLTRKIAGIKDLEIEVCPFPREKQP